MIQLFDSHAHLQDRAFDDDRREVLARANEAGVMTIVLIGEDEASSDRAVQLATQDDRLWATVGLHPHYATRLDAPYAERLTAIAGRPRVVAIGEIGLDYHYDRSPRDVQRRAFEQQLNIASALNLPISIHSRSALADTLAIVEPWSRDRRRSGATGPLGVMHCFGYDVAAAERFAALGFMISIPGTVTFPRAEEVQAVARTVPDDVLVIETDAPVLAPQGHRGRRNEPALLREIAERVATLREVSFARLAELTSTNARRLFRLPVGSEATAVAESVSA